MATGKPNPKHVHVKRELNIINHKPHLGLGCEFKDAEMTKSFNLQVANGVYRKMMTQLVCPAILHPFNNLS